MKITMNIRFTPEQARWFPGSPDMTGLQREMMVGLGPITCESQAATDSEARMKTLMSVIGGGFEGMQKQLWSQMTGQNTKASE